MIHISRSPARFASSLMSSILLSLLLVGTATVSHSADAAATNRFSAVVVNETAQGPQVKITTEKPVGYRYTVYDSFDPVRVVLDFPGMDVSGVQPLIKVDGPVIYEIRLNSFDLTSGKLGRVEILLAGAANYNVELNGNEFNLVFQGLKGPAETPANVAAPQAAAAAPAIAPPPGTQDGSPTAPPAEPSAPEAAAAQPAIQEPAPVVEPVSPPLAPATHIKTIRLDGGTAQIELDGTPEKIQHFPLKSPNRLVVDLYNLKPQFKERTLTASQGFSKVRIGASAEKTRLVFDANGKLPKYTVEKVSQGINITWGKAVAQSVSTSPIAADQSAPATAAKPGGPVTVENVEFQVDDKITLLKITLSGPAQYTAPVADGNLVRFAVKKAGISRSLRRTLDSIAFPSAIKQVTPYLSTEKGKQEVRFAIELKGPAPYVLAQDGNLLLFTVENKQFAEPQPADLSKLELIPPPTVSAEAPAAIQPAPNAEAEIKADVTTETNIETAAEFKDSAVRKRGYTGQKISLVFDNADIRNILQLIGEVSQMNIVAGDEVKGTITLRLIDVPWDQALDLIMETKGLDMLQAGNVIRILPKEKIRAMRQEELKARQEELIAVKEERIAEPMVTEIIQINYTSLSNVSGAIKSLLTKEGKIVEDARNKQLIITDVPSTLKEAKALIEKLDTPERQVMIEARIVEANSSFTRDLGVKWGLTYFNPDSGAGDPNIASIGLGGSFLISPPVGGVLGGAGLGSGITFGQLGINNTTLDLRISALEASGQGKVVSTPRVTTLNGGQASISQGTKIPYQSSGTDGPKTEFVDANLELKVTPVINPDGSVILDIDATNSSIGSTVSTGTGAAPAIDTKEAKTKVLVKNGETTVIGGIFVENENKSEAGVPILRNIPLLGHLFKSTNVTKNRAELLIFITPRILN